MPIHMPTLEEGRIYHRAEVERYIGNQTGTSDYIVMAAHFPRNLQTWENDVRGWRDGEEIVLQYQVYPLGEFKHQLLDLNDTFARYDHERRRVEAIVKCFLDGDPVYPIFLQQNDPQRRITEGMHRAVALFHVESRCIPVFLTGYQNWFTLDATLDGFEREDEIIPASLHEVYGFFMHATCVDQKGIDLVLFDSDRLLRCDEAHVAKHRGKTIGVVTMTVAKDKPSLSTVYVLRQYRRKRVAYRLCEKALLRFKEMGKTDVFCDVQSAGMEATLDQLGRDRPELRALLRVRIGYLPGQDIERGFGAD